MLAVFRAVSLVRYADPIDWGGRGQVHVVIGIAGFLLLLREDV